jgi:hypothetical protein
VRPISIFFLLSLLAFISCKKSFPVSPSENPSSITAAFAQPAIDSLAHTLNKELKFMGISSLDVDSSGGSAIWVYRYVNPTAIASAKPMYWFHATAEGVAFDSTGPMLVGSAVITVSWMNSDAALKIAEANGGSVFRSKNPVFTIQAGLGEPVVPNPTTYWYIQYRSTSDSTRMLFMSIDANTGNVYSWTDARSPSEGSVIGQGKRQANAGVAFSKS